MKVTVHDTGLGIDGGKPQVSLATGNFLNSWVLPPVVMSSFKYPLASMRFPCPVLYARHCLFQWNLPFALSIIFRCQSIIYCVNDFNLPFCIYKAPCGVGRVHVATYATIDPCGLETGRTPSLGALPLPLPLAYHQYREVT